MSWQRNFTEHSTRIAFNLTLTRHMIFSLEVIENFNENHAWVHDGEKRAEAGISQRNDFVPCFRNLEARGLAEHNPAWKYAGDPLYKRNGDKSWVYRLTPAGVAVVELLRIAGLIRPKAVEGGKAA